MPPKRERSVPIARGVIPGHRLNAKPDLFKHGDSVIFKFNYQPAGVEIQRAMVKRGEKIEMTQTGLGEINMRRGPAGVGIKLTHLKGRDGIFREVNQSGKRAIEESHFEGESIRVVELSEEGMRRGERINLDAKYMRAIGAKHLADVFEQELWLQREKISMNEFSRGRKPILKSNPTFFSGLKDGTVVRFWNFKEGSWALGVWNEEGNSIIMTHTGEKNGREYLKLPELKGFSLKGVKKTSLLIRKARMLSSSKRK